MSNDWIKWNGGDCPLPAEMTVCIITREGESNMREAGTFDWSHRGTRGDIVSYRISDTQQAPAPSKPCLCFPGQCRGQVVDGKQPNGDRCKQEYAKSDEAWFDWDTSTLPSHPGMTGHFKLEWVLADCGKGCTHTGEARDPAWQLPADHPARVIRYRWIDPRVMLLNPYTGLKRNAVDIMQDPEGRLVQMASDVQLVSSKLRAASPTTETVAKALAAFSIRPQDDTPYIPPQLSAPSAGEAAWREVSEAIRSLDEAASTVNLSKPVEVVTDPAEIEAAFERDQEAEGAPAEPLKTLGDLITDDEALHVVRNPFGWSEDSVRRARLLLADRFEKVKQQRDEMQKLRDTTVVTIKPTAEWEDLVRRDQAAIGTLMALGYEWKGGEQWAPPIGMAPPFKAHELLDQARNHMKARAATYDKPEGERSMGATVEAFNAITGRDLRESEGWLLMTLLKMVRSETRDAPHRDSVEDLIAYAGLYGEARLGDV